ncbi:hypothetical protein FSP39_022502 [Pinctada imbricata]|uniref:C2H2-type domain-containing protein n=1 Tax=Pinctada imbricata TaxID=66713 RepID=A0AA88XU07_PINIB|nr:hypothetical protein FSP39_022502 [Pinctada imbricata]
MKKRRSSQASVSVDEAKDTNEVLILQESRDDVPATFTVVALDDQNKTSKESTEAKNEDTEQGESNSGNVTPADNDDKSDVHLCIICNRGFINLQHLKNHMMVTHSELRPYVCEYCDAGFTKAQALKTHLQSHAQERPYVCGMCGETFAESKALRSHSNSKHKNAEVDDVKSERKTPDSTEKGSLDITDDVPYASNVSDNEDSRDGNQITHSIKQENDGKLRETDNVELSQFVVIESPQADTLDSESDLEHSKNTEKTSGEDEVGGSNEDSTVALMSMESMNNSQKMVGNIRIELNSEFQSADYDDLDDRLKNDPVFANVGENEEDKQSSFSGHSSNDEFDQSDDTQNDHEFRDAMFP